MVALRWALAVAVAALLAIPIYSTMTERRRAGEALGETADTLLLEEINAHLSRTVPEPMEPLMELLSDGSANEPGGRQ